MLTKAEVDAARERAADVLDNAGIVLTPDERKGIEIADFGLGELPVTGLQIVTYVNNDRYCAKELVLFPNQTCPEHRHPPVSGTPGKMETFRVRRGTVYLYTPGERPASPAATPPRGAEAHYTVYFETVLHPGDQTTLPPDTLHWFRAGPEGAIVSEFSSTNSDEADIFTDPRIQRMPEEPEG